MAAAILLVVMAHVLQRRQQIGALRAFGAPRAAVFAVVWLECFLLVVARFAADVLGKASGITMPVVFAREDWVSIAVLLAAAGLTASCPQHSLAGSRRHRRCAAEGRPPIPRGPRHPGLPVPATVDQPIAKWQGCNEISIRADLLVRMRGVSRPGRGNRRALKASPVDG